MKWFQITALVMTLGVLTGAVIFDVKEKKIPNFLTIPAAAVGLIFTGFTHQKQLIGSLLCVVILFAFAMLGLLGMGDAKLLMALAAWNSWSVVLITLAAASVGLILFRFARSPAKAFCEAKQTICGIRFGFVPKQGTAYPFAPFLAAGYLAAALKILI